MHHVEFFDEDKDGIITITESIKGAYVMIDEIYHVLPG
jgi:hypothetical protein